MQRIVWTSIDNNHGAGKASYTYDANSNKLSETWDSVSNMAAWSFTTEEAGNDGYDAEDRFARFKRSGQSEDIDLLRTDIGNVSNLKLNGNDNLRSYDDAHALTSIAGIAQQFDADGNLTLSQHGSSFSWDEAGRMKQAIVPFDSSVGITGGVKYGYDATGKRVWKTVSPGVGDVQLGIAAQDNASGTGYVMYSVASVHTRFQGLFSVQADHLIVVRHNGTSWQYDNNNSWVDFTSQAGDRLLADVDFGIPGSGIDSVTAITTLGVHAQGINQGLTDTDLVFTPNIWNGIGNSGEVGVAGTWFDSDDSQSTVYIYSGPNCIAEYTAGTAASSPDQEYVYADHIDSLVLIDNGSEELTVLRNQQWSVSALIDRTNGNVLERYAYDVFGKRTILAPDGSTIRIESSYNNPYGYTSRRHDKETGFCYFRARFYDPSSGEFISRDPLEYVDGMSLMRGYFVPDKIDPKGTQLYPIVETVDGRTIWFCDGCNRCHYKDENGEVVFVDCPFSGLDWKEVSIDDAIDAFGKFNEGLEACRNPGKVGVSDAANTFLGIYIDAYLSGIKEFADKNSPCAKWYEETARTLKDAAAGKSVNCPDIGASFTGEGTDAADLCMAHLYPAVKGRIAPLNSFFKFSQKLSAACANLRDCNKCDELDEQTKERRRRRGEGRGRRRPR